jgi:RsiW-degrading membrane proteinase PrsW (M82 family)
MIVLLSFIMAVAPAVFLVYYYYKQDKNKPEPKGLVIKIFFIGFLFIIPAIVLELLLNDLFSLILIRSPILHYFIKAFVVAGICEEVLKLVVVYQFAYKNVHFDEAVDGIVYAIMASLGFACLENILYVIDNGFAVAIFRAFSAIPLHAIASGIMGYYIGQAKFSKSKKEEIRLIIKGLSIAICIHGAYDFVLFSIPELGYLPVLLIAPILIIGFLNLRKKINSALQDDILNGRIQEFEMMKVTE